MDLNGWRGTLGGTQYRNTVRKIGKSRNTVSKMDEIPTPHLRWVYPSVFLFLFLFFFLSQACIRQKSTSAFARKREKVWN